MQVSPGRCAAPAPRQPLQTNSRPCDLEFSRGIVVVPGVCAATYYMNLHELAVTAAYATLQKPGSGAFRRWRVQRVQS